MKHTLPLFLLIFALLLSACSTSSTQSDDEVFSFYYPAKSKQNGSVFSTLALNSSFAGLTPSELMEQYLSVAVPADAISIPSTWQLQSVTAEESVCSVVFSGRSVSAAERSLLCAAIAKTLLQLPNLQRISITTPGSAAPLTLSAEDILTEDRGMFPQEEQLLLYYPDSESRYLLRLTRTVENISDEEKPALILQELLSGGLLPMLPSRAELLSVNVEDGICTVDLSAQFAAASYSFAEERLLVYSIVNSLTELSQIETVEFWVEGAPLERLDWLTLSGGLTHDVSMLDDPVDTGLLDRTLYVTCDNRDGLVGIPLHLSAIDTLSAHEQLLSALIAYEGSSGIANPVPAGTRLLSLRLEDRTCIVDLTAEFLDGCPDASAEEAAVRAVIATLCSLGDIDSVELLVEGIEPSYRDETLSRVHRPDENWFAE